jgi:plasmid stabilization system protein ParE
MSYRIEFTERARRDINRLLDSLAERSPEAAERLSARFEESLSRLEQFPLSCGVAYENPRFDEEVRHLLFGLSKERKYRALFTVRGDEVVILAIGAPGEQPVNPDDIAG